MLLPFHTHGGRGRGGDNRTVVVVAAKGGKGRWRLLLTHAEEGEEAVEVWGCTHAEGEVGKQRLLVRVLCWWSTGGIFLGKGRVVLAGCQRVVAGS